MRPLRPDRTPCAYIHAPGPHATQLDIGPTTYGSTDRLRPVRAARIVLPMSAEDDRQRFRHLPDPVLPEDAVETVDAGSARVMDDEGEERARMLREAAGA
jgi:hypothetical protein